MCPNGEVSRLVSISSSSGSKGADCRMLVSVTELEAHWGRTENTSLNSPTIFQFHIIGQQSWAFVVASGANLCDLSHVSVTDVFRTSEEWTAVIFPSEFWILYLLGNIHKLYSKACVLHLFLLSLSFWRCTTEFCKRLLGDISITSFSFCTGWKTKEKWSASSFPWGTRYWLCRELWRVW